MKSTYDVEQAKEAQARYCTINGVPHFAPYSGICYKCRKNIYEQGKGFGISVERASSQLVTGCPHCHYSFCE